MTQTDFSRLWTPGYCAMPSLQFPLPSCRRFAITEHVHTFSALRSERIYSSLYNLFFCPDVYSRNVQSLFDHTVMARMSRAWLCHWIEVEVDARNRSVVRCALACLSITAEAQGM